MRTFRTILVVLILIGLPAVSWYYLEKGKDWRVRGLEEIAQRTQVHIPALMTYDNRILDSTTLLGKYCIVVQTPLDVPDTVLQELHDQFSKNPAMLLLRMHTGDEEPTGDWTNVRCTDSPCRDLLQRLMPDPANGALIDDSLQVRRTYDLHKEQEVRKLVEHAAILIPVEKRKEIELKRDR